MRELCDYLVERGYMEDHVERQVDRVHRISRTDSLRDNQPVNNNRIPFVVIFHPALPNIGKILQHRFSNCFAAMLRDELGILLLALPCLNRKQITTILFQKACFVRRMPYSSGNFNEQIFINITYKCV